MQESGLTEIIPLLCISAIWGQDPVLSHPETPQGVTHGEWLQQLLLDDVHPVSLREAVM